MTSRAADLLQFAQRFFDALRAPAERIPAGLRVELTAEQRARLEDRPLWSFGRWTWEPDASVTTLYLAFDEDGAEAETRADLVAPGSLRLQQMCAAALREWALGRAFIPVPEGDPARLWPYMVFHFLVTCVGHDVRQRIASIAVDLVRGRAFPCPSLSELPLQPTAHGADAEQPRLTVGEAHGRAVDALCERLADEDASWYHEKRQWIEDELDRLYSYLQQASSEQPHDGSWTSWTRARLDELRELNRPRVELRARAATLLYAPDYWPNPSAMYLSRRMQ